MIWWPAISLPCWRRTFAYSTASSNAACAMPTLVSPTNTRAVSKSLSVWNRPPPERPSTFSTGAVASSKYIWQVDAPTSPILSSSRCW